VAEAWSWPHSLQFRAKVKNAWIYTSTPRICLHSV